MTPKQKQQKLTDIKSLINVAGFTIDHYGNYKTSLDGTDYRIKLKKVNIRIESKQSSGKIWYKILSEPITKIDITKLILFMKRFL